jgi:hypothetical protein
MNEANSLAVVHDGTPWQFHNPPWRRAHPPVLSFSVLPDLTTIGTGAFSESTITDLSGLRGSSIAKICADAFYQTAIASLDPLPPTLLEVGANAFALCHSLPNLRGLPYHTSPHPLAFRGCRQLLAKAHALGFPGIHYWAEDRKLIPVRRAHTLLCVRFAIEQESDPDPEAPVSPLLKKIAKLPSELVREVVLFLDSDHQ